MPDTIVGMTSSELSAARQTLLDPQSSAEDLSGAKDVLINLITKFAVELSPDLLGKVEIPNAITEPYYDALNSSREFIVHWHSTDVADGPALWNEYQEMSEIFQHGIAAIHQWGKDNLEL
jgi:hypothetical protein